MKKRIVFLLLIFLSFWGGFLLQKPLFMLYNGAIGKGTALADYFRVLYHGASLDKKKKVTKRKTAGFRFEAAAKRFPSEAQELASLKQPALLFAGTHFSASSPQN